MEKKNKKMILLSSLLLVLVLLPLTTYSAEGGKLGVGIRGGWYKSQDADQGKVYGGIQARWRVLPALSIEGLVDYRYEQSFPNNRKITSYPVLVSALFYPIPESKISPYLLAGAGWYYSKLEDRSGSTWTNDFGVHAGAGVDIPLSPMITFNADLRYYILDINDQKVSDLTTSGYLISAGLTFYMW